MVSSGGGEVGAAKLTGEVLNVITRIPQVQLMKILLKIYYFISLDGREYDGRKFEPGPGQEVNAVSREAVKLQNLLYRCNCSIIYCMICSKYDYKKICLCLLVVLQGCALKVRKSVWISVLTVKI